jgi:hypothetical protein
MVHGHDAVCQAVVRHGEAGRRIISNLRSTALWRTGVGCIGPHSSVGDVPSIGLVRTRMGCGGGSRAWRRSRCGLAELP